MSVMTVAETIGEFRRGQKMSGEITAAGKAEANMVAGRAVCRGTAEGTFKLPASSANVARVLGVTVYDPFKPYGTSTEEYASGEVVEILQKGVIVVETEGAVTAGGIPYVRHTANGGETSLGKFRADADTSNAAALPNAEFLDTLSGAGLARVQINLPG